MLVVHERAHARERESGKIRQGLLEQIDIAGEKRAQNQSCGQLAAVAQVADERRNLALRRCGRERDGRLFASLLDDALGAIFRKPRASRDEACKRIGQFRHQRLARLSRQAVARQHGLADGGEMAVARDHTVERKRRDFGS